MLFILQQSVYKEISETIKTKSGRDSLTSQIKCLYIIHRLNHKRIFEREDYKLGVPMNTEILASLFGGGNNPKRFLNVLVEKQFIRKTKNSQNHISSARYQLHDKIFDEKVFTVNFEKEDSKLIDKLEARNDDRKSTHKQLESMIKHLTVNEEGVKYLQSKYQEESFFGDSSAVSPEDYIISSILNKNFFASRPDLRSRVYTNITSLPRIHRKYLKVNESQILMTDISNSQILLTVPLLLKHWAEHSGNGLRNLPSDVMRFQKLAESGLFYEEMARLSDEALGFDRGEFKKKVFGEIWFSKNSSRNTSIKKAFKAEFPTVDKIIWGLKGEKHNEFAIKLQRFEASIIVDKVWNKLNKMGKIVFTLHDAIVCSNKADLDLSENLIRDELSKFSIEPKFKREIDEITNVAA